MTHSPLMTSMLVNLQTKTGHIRVDACYPDCVELTEYFVKEGNAEFKQLGTLRIPREQLSNLIMLLTKIQNNE